MGRFLAAVAFLTTLPVGKGKAEDREGFAKSMIFFPLVGLGMGAVAVGINAVLARFLPLPLRMLIVLGTFTLAGESLHMDGWADTSDGLFGGKDPEERIRIMGDTRVGTAGILSLIFLVLWKFLCLVFIGERGNSYVLNGALVLTPALGRWSMVNAARLGHPARPEGMGKSFLEMRGRRDWLIATGTMLIFSVLMFPRGTVVLLPLAFAISLALTLAHNKWLGGHTGDTLGSVNEATEALILGVIVILAARGVLLGDFWWLP